MITKEQFLSQVWAKIHQFSCEALDAVIETAEVNDLDMESAGKLAARDSTLKALLESQARDQNCLK